MTAPRVLVLRAPGINCERETFDAYVFFFRTLAGLYFVLLYQLRGFGVAVGAHAGYDVLVGLLIDG